MLAVLCALACTATLTLVGLAGTAHAQTAAGAPVVYPAKGQPAAQQDRDKYECHDWARGQTGFDPLTARAPSGSPAGSSATSVSAAAMAKGAMGGAAVAELTDHNAGKGAAAGVMGAAMVGQVRQAQAKQLQEQQAAQQQAALNQQRATFGRAFAACLEARGYVVK